MANTSPNKNPRTNVNVNVRPAVNTNPRPNPNNVNVRYNANPNAQYYNPNAQYYNPNAQYNNPNAQYNNPNAQYYNPNAQYRNPNAQYNNPNAQYNNPNARYYAGNPGAYANIGNDSKKPNYVMRKSAWSVIKWWHILFGFLIIPLLIMLWKIINIKDETISFYGNKVVHKEGILNLREQTTILTQVYSVTVNQTFWGRIFNYGNLTIDVAGPWDIDTTGIKSPRKAKKFLETLAANGRTVRPIIMN